MKRYSKIILANLLVALGIYSLPVAHAYVNRLSNKEIVSLSRVLEKTAPKEANGAVAATSR